MNCHWERINADTIALYPDGATWKGELILPEKVTAIHTIGPTLLPNARTIYKAVGYMVESTQDFDSLEKAISGVESLARVAGHAVDGR